MAQARSHGGPDVSADTRRRIMDAAFELMAEHGFAGTAISMVAKRSGASASSIYWFFESKDGLLASVVGDISRRWLFHLPRWDDMEGPSEERLAALLGEVGRNIVNDPTPMRLFILLALELREDANPGPLEVLRSVHASAQQGLRVAFRRIAGAHDDLRRHEDEVVAFAAALVNGAVVAQILDPEFEIGASLDMLTEVFTAYARGRTNTEGDTGATSKAP